MTAFSPMRSFWRDLMMHPVLLGVAAGLHVMFDVTVEQMPVLLQSAMLPATDR
jgi:hypothetical protein